MKKTSFLKAAFQLILLGFVLLIGIGGHCFESEITKAPSVEVDGERVFQCKYCDESYTEKIDKLDKCVPYLAPYQTDNLVLYKGDQAGQKYFTVMVKKIYEGEAV